ncbi:MAG: NAD(P)H-binding protein [Chitinophagaceae bacterium]|nr:NAD(P)H-binding protein [Chitinophagaceae bacterium]
MKIAVIGASAGIGLETVKRALDRSHSVTTLSRSKIGIADNENLTQINGSATNKADLQKALENAKAVLVTLGTGKSIKATTLYSDFGKLLVEIQRESKLDIPFIIVTGFGAGESIKYAPFSAKLMMNLLLKAVYADKTKMEEMIAGSDMNWTIVRPGFLKNGTLTESYTVENRLYKGIKMGKINRADVADFLVKQAEQNTEAKKYVTIRAN